MRTKGEGRVAGAETGVRVRLLDGFEVAVDGEPLELPLASQRLVAFLALQDRPVLRSHVAGSLWTDRSEERAGACLRSALWRSNKSGPLVVSGRTQVRLGTDVAVDARETASVARGLLRGEDASVDVSRLQGELLPDWYDDWVLLERERLRQLCLHALEQLSTSLLTAGQIPLAVEAALTIVLAEPLRESAHRALIEAHLAAGNRYEAMRQYRRYEEYLDGELGLRPSDDLQQLLLNRRLLSPVE